MKITVIYTHKGWFGLCPVYFANLQSEAPTIDPRHWALGWLMDFSEGFFGVFHMLRSMFDPMYEPEWMLMITGELPNPLLRTHEFRKQY